MNRLGIGIRLRILLQPILALRLSLVLALSLAGCGGRPASGTLPEGVLAVQAIPWSSQPDLVGKVMAVTDSAEDVVVLGSLGAALFTSGLAVGSDAAVADID